MLVEADTFKLEKIVFTNVSTLHFKYSVYYPMVFIFKSIIVKCMDVIIRELWYITTAVCNTMPAGSLFQNQLTESA